MLSYGNFITKENVDKKTEIEKFKYTMYYFYKTQNRKEIELEEIKNILVENNIYISNFSRLKSNIKKSKAFKKCEKTGKYTLTTKALDILEKEIEYLENEDYIETDGSLLDMNKFMGAKGYLDKLIFQANHCFENNCYDACATLLRRILEILLILAYQNLNIDHEIKDTAGNYFLLEKICNNAKQNKSLNLSRIRNELDSFRNIGNYAAHRIEYNTTRNDIEKIIINYRTILEELYYKAGLKK